MSFCKICTGVFGIDILLYNTEKILKIMENVEIVSVIYTHSFQ